MSITLETAQTAETATEIETRMLDDLAAEGVEETGYGDLSVARTLVTLEARAEAREQEIRTTVVAAGFGDTAVTLSDAWVDLFVPGWWGITRDPAVKAVWLCVATVTAGNGPYADITPGRLVATTDDGVEFENVDKITLSSAAPVNLLLRARQAGLSGNVPVGAITKLVTSYPGTSLAPAADSLITSGRDAESSLNLIERGRARFGATAAGASAPSYIEWVSKAFEGTSNPVTKVRVDDTNPNGPGSVAVYLAEATGAAQPATVTTANTYLQARHPAGAGELTVASVDELAIDVAGTVYASGNEDVLADITTLLAALQVELQGATVIYVSELIDRIMGVDGVYNLVLSLTEDITVQANEVPVFTNSLVEG